MAITDVALRAGEVEGPARADIQWFEPRDRALGALGVGFAGVAIGGLSILTPGVHLVFTWLAPAMGVLIALTAARLSGWVRGVSGACPSCGADFSAKGPGPVWVEAPSFPCPHCDAALAVSLPR